MISKKSCYRIRQLESDESILRLSAEAANLFNLDLRKPVTLKFGNLTSLANIILDQSGSTAEVQVSTKLMKNLKIPTDLKINLKSTRPQELKLGPIIGILTFPHVYAKKAFGFYLNHQAMLQNGLLYVFTSYGIDPQKNTISGHYFNSTTKTWSQAEFPYPDAVLDRCYPNAYWAHKHLERVIGTGRIFNKKTMINKLDFYAALCNDKLLKSHLPKTKLCTNVSDLNFFLEKYGEVFLKPLRGMQGLGILTAALVEDNLKCRYMVNGQMIEKEMTSPQQILELLKVFGHPKRQYIIQESIPRMGYQGNPFCFRVMVCKDGNGHWLVPAIFTNAATGDSFLTNHASGASRFVPLNNLFQDIEQKLTSTRAAFMDTIAILSIKTATLLDAKYGPLGELGLDIVVDPSGIPFLLEANGNPGMVPRSHRVDFPDWSYQVFHLPISYAVNLAGFN